MASLDMHRQIRTFINLKLRALTKNVQHLFIYKHIEVTSKNGGMYFNKTLALCSVIVEYIKILGFIL